MSERWISPIADEGIYYIDTGKWRTHRPRINYELCNRCSLCAFFCPVSSVKKDYEKDRLYIDLSFCKGCGICAAECPMQAIEMVIEEEEGEKECQQ